MVEGRLGGRLDYARVDLMRDADGGLAVSEVEVTEPGLYLDLLPGNAAAFGRPGGAGAWPRGPRTGGQETPDK